MVVVFESPTTPSIESTIIEIVNAPEAAANSADDQIVRLVAADPQPADITVVTSDSTLAERVRTAGAGVHSAAGFRRLIDPG